MARYIDADKLTDKLEELQFNASVMIPLMRIYDVIELVEDQPTADVVEVVRCKKCKHGEVSIISKTTDGKERIACYCNLKNGVTSLDYYCANGERGVVDA